MLAAHLRQARGACGLTYDELSTQAGVSPATLKRAASTAGRVAPRRVVERYAGACG
ncbi:helix-turn-helix domain-containing protein, partial [Streptomyces cadmiisoli]